MEGSLVIRSKVRRCEAEQIMCRLAFEDGALPKDYSALFNGKCHLLLSDIMRYIASRIVYSPFIRFWKCRRFCSCGSTRFQQSATNLNAKPQTTQYQSNTINKILQVSTGFGIWFGTRGSEVQILSPRPIIPKQLIGLARMPFCGFPQFGSVWVQLANLPPSEPPLLPPLARSANRFLV